MSAIRQLRSAGIALACVGLWSTTGAARAQDRVVSTEINGVTINLFLPGDVKVFKGATINPADEKVGAGSAWSETFRNLDMCQMGLNIDRKRTNRPTVLREAMLAAFKKFAKETDHPELEHLPLCGGGFSAGGGWSAAIVQALPERGITYACVCSWVPPHATEAQRKLPGLIVIGSVPDGFKMLDAIPKDYDPARKEGALWTLALTWGCAHNWGNTSTLMMPYMDAVVRLRVPADADPSKGPVRLKDLQLEDGWLGDRGTWESNLAEIASYRDFKGDEQAATWLPNKSVAYVWRSLMSKDPPLSIDASTADGKIKLPADEPKTKRAMVAPAGSQIVLEATVRKDSQEKGRIDKVVFYAGDRVIGEARQAPWKMNWTDAAPGPHAVYVQYEVAGKLGVSQPGLVVVRRPTTLK